MRRPAGQKDDFPIVFAGVSSTQPTISRENRDHHKGHVVVLRSASREFDRRAHHPIERLASGYIATGICTGDQALFAPLFVLSIHRLAYSIRVEDNHVAPL